VLGGGLPTDDKDLARRYTNHSRKNKAPNLHLNRQRNPGLHALFQVLYGIGSLLRPDNVDPVVVYGRSVPGPIGIHGRASLPGYSIKYIDNLLLFDRFVESSDCVQASSKFDNAVMRALVYHRCDREKATCIQVKLP
jgi:hypothetical protein